MEGGVEAMRRPTEGSKEVELKPGSKRSNLKYFINFVDEFSRMIWVYVINLKSEAFGYFMRFKASVERESGKKLKILNTDGGGEFTSNAFELHCQQNRIRHEVSAPYTPQHNGLAKRRNMTIMDMKHVPDQRRTKLQDKDEAMEMITSLKRIIPEIIDEEIISEGSSERINNIPIDQRSRRTRSMPTRFNDFEMHYDYQISDEGDLVHLALIARVEQINEIETLQHPVWKEAMVEELKSIEKNKTWLLVDLPKGKH
ncbi:PREDICTED: uncharacterized protein LOC109344707 [Lupinus angustifolius]|uniref:uncharacterized protein LOC109344707 n=1 Tax=Lupinus angustifolius TaxID=3871 RepID=UPI00092FA911|nr:PREDICTED: uncharacterized protein LOC109344707 [Lupinus angustifolius]